jgi:hypothetical protein
MARNIVEKHFDIIIELRSRNREDNNPHNYLFEDITEELNSDVIKCCYIIPENKDFGIMEIQRIISKMDRYLAKGKKILFHAQGRTDRLALVIASWLIKHKLADENNFIYKIALLRLGFSINNIDDDPQKQWEHNRFFETNCDRTRTFQIIIGKTFFVKHRQMQFVPFYFTKAKNEEINYWTREFMKVDYNVDPEALEIIRHFGVKQEKNKSEQELSDERYFQLIAKFKYDHRFNLSKICSEEYHRDYCLWLINTYPKQMGKIFSKIANSEIKDIGRAEIIDEDTIDVLYDDSKHLLCGIIKIEINTSEVITQSKDPLITNEDQNRFANDDTYNDFHIPGFWLNINPKSDIIESEFLDLDQIVNLLTECLLSEDIKSDDYLKISEYCEFILNFFELISLIVENQEAMTKTYADLFFKDSEKYIALKPLNLNQHWGKTAIRTFCSDFTSELSDFLKNKKSQTEKPCRIYSKVEYNFEQDQFFGISVVDFLNPEERNEYGFFPIFCEIEGAVQIVFQPNYCTIEFSGFSPKVLNKLNRKLKDLISFECGLFYDQFAQEDNGKIKIFHYVTIKEIIFRMTDIMSDLVLYIDKI